MRLYSRRWTLYQRAHRIDDGSRPIPGTDQNQIYADPREAGRWALELHVVLSAVSILAFFLVIYLLVSCR